MKWFVFYVSMSPKIIYQPKIGNDGRKSKTCSFRHHCIQRIKQLVQF